MCFISSIKYYIPLIFNFISRIYIYILLGKEPIIVFKEKKNWNNERR